MATDTDPTETPDAPDAETDVPSPDAPEGPDIEIIEEEAPAPAPAASAAPTASARSPGTLAELSENLREAAAEIADIAAQAGRLGVPIDAAKALREGTAPEALRKLVLSRAAAAADARDIIAAPPSPVLPKSTESPIVAAAKRAASGAKI